MVGTGAESDLTAGDNTSNSRPLLLLYLSRDGDSRDASAIPTLALTAANAGIRFDAYREGPRAGIHHGGGDPRRAKRDFLLGGTLIGARHLEAAISLAARFEVLLAVLESSLLEPHLLAHGARTVAKSSSLADLYTKTALAVGVTPPAGLTLIGPALEGSTPGVRASAPVVSAIDVGGFGASIPGIEFYAAPLAYELGATCFPLGDPGWRTWNRAEGPVSLLLGGGTAAGPAGDEIPAGAASLVPLEPGDDYASVTVRLFKALRTRPRSVFLADPPLVSHCLPAMFAGGWAPVFGLPLSAAMGQIEEHLTAGSVAFGRVFEDADFFDLSRRGVSLQIIDPGRPPFSACGWPPAGWQEGIALRETALELPAGSRTDPGQVTAVDHSHDPTDAELERFARAGTVLVSLAFWAGAIRELETLYVLFDLVATTGLKCGVALTCDSYELGGGLVSLLSAPASGGGTFPNIEPLLGSAGDGIATEAMMPPAALSEHLRGSMARIAGSAPAPFRPTGWWVTMDGEFIDRPASRRPPRIVFRDRAGWTGGAAENDHPFLKLRYRKKSQHRIGVPGSGNPAASLRAGESGAPGRSSLKAGLERWVRANRLDRYFEPYRPFEFKEAGRVPAGVWEAACDAGLRYVLTKTGFERGPILTRGPGGFLAINHTAGQWDGWTPFETVNRLRDLERAERDLLASHAPGWLLTSVDTCLWAFSGELWNRAGELRRIADFCVSGGRSGRLVPALPRTIARYADLCDRLGLLAGARR